MQPSIGLCMYLSNEVCWATAHPPLRNPSSCSSSDKKRTRPPMQMPLLSSSMVQKDQKEHTNEPMETPLSRSFLSTANFGFAFNVKRCVLTLRSGVECWNTQHTTMRLTFGFRNHSHSGTRFCFIT